jgi:hypothetical protein
MLFAAFALRSVVAFAQNPPAQQSAVQEIMRRMTPGNAHKVLAKMAGKWRGTLKIWNSAAPTAAPRESTVETETKLILGGRFAQTESQGLLMRLPMQRISILGFDNLTQQYTLVFYSNLDTATNMRWARWAPTARY